MEPNTFDDGPAALEQATATTISGLPYVGQALTMTPGTAKGGTEPLASTYSWQKGKDGSWSDIGGYTGTTYTVQGEDMDFSLRGVTTITDSAEPNAELVMASAGTVAVSKEPEIQDPDSEFSSTAQYEFKNLVETFRSWKQRDLKLTLVDAFTAKIEQGGKISNGGVIENAPTEGELEMVSKWLQFRWGGEMIDNSAVDGTFTLRAVPGGFSPGGGRTPRPFIKNS